MPVYLTFKQANDLGAHVKKGESAIPVLYWDIMARDKDGRKITKEAYRKMSLAEQMQVKTIPFLKAYNVFNIEQTNLTEVKPDKVEALKKQYAGMYTGKEQKAEKNKAGYKEELKKIKNADGTPTAIIKPMDESTYLNLINVLDEMQNCYIGKYVIDKVNDHDKQMVEDFKK